MRRTKVQIRNAVETGNYFIHQRGYVLRIARCVGVYADVLVLKIPENLDREPIAGVGETVQMRRVALENMVVQGLLTGTGKEQPPL